MLMKTTALVLCSLALGAGPAFAVTITNQDSKPHTLVINNGSKDKQQVVAPGKTVTASCPDKCGFRDLAFGTSRVAGGKTKLVIDKDGELHFIGGEGDFQMKNGTN